MVGEICEEGQYVSQEKDIALQVFRGKVDRMPAATGYGRKVCADASRLIVISVMPPIVHI